MRAESEEVKDAISEAAFADVAPTAVSNESWQQPVLNASPSGITPDMLAQLPGWSAEVIEQYMAQFSATCERNPKRSRTPLAKLPLPTLRRPPSQTSHGSNRC